MKIDSVPAVVTGGASGLGKACAEMLCALGARVIIADIDEDAGRRIARKTGAEFMRTDVRNVSDVEALFDHIGANDPVRILVTCAGVAPKLSMTGENGPFCMDAFRYVLETNLSGTILPISRFVDRLKDVEPLDEETGVKEAEATGGEYILNPEQGEEISMAYKGIEQIVESGEEPTMDQLMALYEAVRSVFSQPQFNEA